MPASVLYMSMSLDGYIAGANDGPGNPGGDGFMRLHEWLADGESGRPSGPAGEMLDQMNATGAVLVGRRTAEQVDHYKGDHHGVPIVVVSHRPPPPSMTNYPLVTYVTDGIVGAMAQAKTAAGDRNVLVHGAAGAGGRGTGRGADPPDPGAVGPGAPDVRRLAVARRAGRSPGDRHTGGHPHPLPRPSLTRW